MNADKNTYKNILNNHHSLNLEEGCRGEGWDLNIGKLQGVKGSYRDVKVWHIYVKVWHIYYIKVWHIKICSIVWHKCGTERYSASFEKVMTDG